MLATLNEATAVGDEMKLACGLAIISTDAFDLGATAVPDPAGDAEFPWLYWTEFALTSTTTDDRNAIGASNMRVEVDSRAMRKVKPGESMAWIFQYVDIAGAPVVDVQVNQMRVLLGN